MATEVAVGLLSLAGTLIGSLAGIMVSNKLVNYRLEQLEKKVDKHNNLVERMYQCESRLDTLEKIGGYHDII
jgi:flagellar motor component MotA